MKNIGFLLEGVAGLYHSSLWPGVVDSAKKHGCNLICFAGGALRMSPNNPYEVQRNIVYDFVDVSKLDALVFSGTLNNFISDEEFAKFMERFGKLPMISLTPMFDNIPSLVVDNTSGMKSLVSHLALDHKCKNFAFITGPKGNLDADQRLDLFRKYLKEYGVKCNEDLIVSGDYSRKNGYNAVLELIKKNRKFDALIAANDETALGAMAALQDNNIRVPEDVAVTGFDGIEESELTTPPLTTVRQPLYEIGSTAVELLVAKINGEEIPMRTVLQNPLVIRQSCGCYINPEHSLDARTTQSIFSPSKDLSRAKEYLTETLSTFVALEMGNSADIEGDDLKELATAFFDEIEGKAHNVFLPTLNRVVRAVALACEDAADKNILQWQKLLAIFRKFTQNLDLPKLELADTLLHEGYNLFGETVARQQAHKRLQVEQKAALLRRAGYSIANTFDFQGLTQAIVQMFPDLGINDFYLSLYDKTVSDKSGKHYQTSKPIMELHGGKKHTPPADSAFATKDLIMGGLKDDNSPYQIIVQPLHFKNKQLGLAVFKNGPLTGYIYDILGEHLSGALQGALLMDKIQKQALTLEENNRELTILREKERIRLEAIEHELQIGRAIQQSFFPESMPKIEKWQSQALFMPAREVSGDFYDAFKLEDGSIAFIIADVSGKDVGAALFMSLIRSLIRAFAEFMIDYETGKYNPLNAVEFTNRYIVNHHQSTKGRFMYATLFFAVIDPATGVVKYINAGHNPPAVLRPEGGTAVWLAPTGPAVGVGVREDLVYRQESFVLKPGEILLPYTDGVIEAKNESGEFFTQKRFTELIEKPYKTLDEVFTRVRDALDEHGEGTVPYDDVTMIGVFREF